jgi:hypothetical protein
MHPTRLMPFGLQREYSPKPKRFDKSIYAIKQQMKTHDWRSFIELLFENIFTIGLLKIAQYVQYVRWLKTGSEVGQRLS